MSRTRAAVDGAARSSQVVALLVALVVALVVAVAACAAVPAVGSLALDDTKLRDDPMLAHLGAALDPAAAGSGDVRVRELFDNDVHFARAPDPTALLEDAARTNPPADPDAVSLTVLSWNVGLLDTRPLVPGLPRFVSPHLDERRRMLPGVIATSGYDVVLLQEVWRDGDVALIAHAASRAGYLVATSPREDSVDGLMVLVKRAMVGGDHKLHATSTRYQDQEVLEAILGPHIERGYLAVKLTHPLLGDVVLFDTHMMSFGSYWPQRQRQARQLGLAVRGVSADALVVVGGDMNAGLFYKLSTWVEGDGYVEDKWWQNAMCVPTLMHYGGLVDVYARGRGPRAADEVRYGSVVTHPLAAGFCRDVPPDVFSAYDCNSLYVAQYPNQEPPHRLDHVLARDPMGRVHVDDSALVLFETRRPIGGAGAPVEPSDHSAVSVKMRVARRIGTRAPDEKHETR